MNKIKYLSETVLSLCFYFFLLWLALAWMQDASPSSEYFVETESGAEWH